MKRYQDKHCVVYLSEEGLRRAANDNSLHLAASRRHERIARLARDIVCAVALGLLLGYTAAQTAGVVS